jgi:Zn-dependent protease
MLSEPVPTAYDLNFRLLGIPVRISPWFWLAGLLLGARSSGPVSLLLWVAALLASILVHELGHAVVIRSFGFRPWITLYGFGGLTSYDPRPVYRSPESETWGRVAISLAGPVAGLLLAALLWLGLVAAGHRPDIVFGPPLHLTPWVRLPNLRLAEFLNYIFFISVAWGLVNLLPVYPLDGGQIAREIALRFYPGDGLRYSLVLSLVVGIAMALIALQQWHDGYVAVLFGLLAYFNFVSLRAML